jgi:hypothetical protein
MEESVEKKFMCSERINKISPPPRRGAEPDERSESDEVGWWKSLASFIVTSL